MGLLDFQNFRARSGAGAGAAPKYGNVPMRQPTGNIPTSVFTGPQATGSYAPPAKPMLPSLSGQLTGHDPSMLNMAMTGGDWQGYMNKGGPSPLLAATGKFTDSLGLGNAADPFGIFKPKDSYGPLQTKNDPTQNYSGYFQSNPDVQGEWNSFSNTEKNRLFAGDPNNYADWHFNTFGKNEGRKLTPFADMPTIVPQATRPPVNSGWTPGQMPTLGTLRG